jgi:NAD(P)-dependent dehydrogenase (short-subunit alcohol dehydrogenase family)
MAGSKPLSEITVAITGAAGGLGKAIAQAFLDAGSKVAICDVNQERLDQVKEEWKAHEGRILVSRTDITDEAEVEAFVQGVTEKLGGLDIFINNAGIMDKFDAVATTPKAVWDRVIGVNATGAVSSITSCSREVFHVLIMCWSS